VTAAELPWVISVDDHVVEPPNVWADRLSAKDRDVGPHVVQDTCETIFSADRQGAQYVKGGDGPVVDWWVYEDVLRPIPQVVACAGFPPETFTLAPIPYTEMRAGCYDSAARIADMDINRTERSLCFPFIPRFAGQLFHEAHDKDLAHRCVQAYNDWMVDEWCAPHGGRLIPLAIVPLWDARLAADEVRLVAARGCRAITFTELPTYLGLPSIHSADRWWDPLFDACNETHTVICMHIGSGSRMTTTSADAPQGVQAALTSINAQMALADWLLSGALARFPELKIAFSESQVGWMPYLLDRLDHVFTRSSGWGDFDPSLTEKPSSYLPGRVYGCFYDDPVGVAARDVIGIGSLVFETDYPHQDTTWPDTPKIVADIAEQVTPAELEQLVRTNAIDMLGLDPADLRPAPART
jgi:predicted TIM-barrel fold metal-dependent hydrolase